MVKKSAFTLIELIFAIVIIAITITSLPMMNKSVEKGISSNIVQEAIFAAATELTETTTASWDENSFEENETNSLARVIDISSNPIRCENNSSADNYRLLKGHINQPLHRRCLDDNETTYSNTDVDGVTSLWDMTHSSQNIFIDSTTDDTGYKQEYNSTVDIIHPADFNGSSYNIKKIIITITSTDGTVITRLSTYSMNIGEVDYLKKEY